MLIAAVVAAAIVAVIAVLSHTTVEAKSPPIGGGTTPDVGTSVDIARHCPWLEAGIQQGLSDAALAQLVLNRMTVAEKLNEVVLYSSGLYENINAGVPRLCVPSLAVQDGPQGVGFNNLHVTQLPAPLGIAASFNTSIASTYGQVEGAESTAKGYDTVQGPTLNIDRVPESGRTYEGFGEDPVLASAMGVADIEGIQSTGSMAMAKEFAVYSQETDRGVLNENVSERAIQELYLPPFKAAVTQAHVSTIMCAYPRLNGTFQCQQPQLVSLLRQWGFEGFVRSDLGAVHDPVAALTAGTDLIKPEDAADLTALVQQNQLPIAAVNAAVARILGQMFAHGVIGKEDPVGSPANSVDSAAHTTIALRAAESSAVLLKNTDSVLPLSSGRPRTVAIIGADASSYPVTTGFGSSWVVAPFTSTPLSAITASGGCGDIGHLFERREHVGEPTPDPHRSPDTGLRCRAWPDPDPGSDRLRLGASHPHGRRAHRRSHHQPPSHVDLGATSIDVHRSGRSAAAGTADRRQGPRPGPPTPPDHVQRGPPSRMDEHDRGVDGNADPAAERALRALAPGVGWSEPHP